MSSFYTRAFKKLVLADYFDSGAQILTQPGHGFEIPNLVLQWGALRLKDVCNRHRKLVHVKNKLKKCFDF